MRIGAAERVRPDLQSYTIEELASKHPLAPEIEMMEGQLEDLWKRNQNGRLLRRDDKDRQLMIGELMPSSQRMTLSRELKQQLHQKRAAIFADVLMDADVVSHA